MITRDGREGRHFPISFFQTPGICGTLECLVGEMLAIWITLVHSHYIENRNSHPQAAVTELSPFEWFIYYSIIAKTDAQHLQMWNPLFVQIIPPKSFLPLPPDHRRKEEFTYWKKAVTKLHNLFSLTHNHKRAILFTGKREKHPLVHTCWCYTLNPQLPCLPAKDQEFLLNFHSLSLLWNCVPALPLCRCEANLHLMSPRSAKTRKGLKKGGNSLSWSTRTAQSFLQPAAPPRTHA